MPALKGPRESSLQATCLAALRARGGWWQRKSGHSPYESSGIPDIYGCYAGTFVAFELKRPGAKRGLTATQEHTLYRIKKCGGLASTITSVAQALHALDILDGFVND